MRRRRAEPKETHGSLGQGGEGSRRGRAGVRAIGGEARAVMSSNYRANRRAADALARPAHDASLCARMPWDRIQDLR
jgi:hypothetical protein